VERVVLRKVGGNGLVVSHAVGKYPVEMRRC
jgi:hypothetical protein